MENNDDNLSLLEKNLLNSHLHIVIGEYLSLNDNINLITISKKIYYNKINKYYCKYVITNLAKKIITRFIIKIYYFKKMITEDDCIMYINNNTLTKRYLALYYFKFYDKIHINNWYNFIPGLKRIIIEKYKTKITNNPNSFDLYNLIKRIPVEDTLFIGW
jgi:hypothetical protein